MVFISMTPQKHCFNEIHNCNYNEIHNDDTQKLYQIILKGGFPKLITQTIYTELEPVTRR